MLPPSSRSIGTCIVRTRQSQTLIDLAPIAEVGLDRADGYRVQAAKLKAQARRETNLDVRRQLEGLADCYLRLADQADRNQRTDVAYEPPLRQHR